jgi:sorting nexin-4
MAVLDEDNFSNISWHSEQNPDAAGPSTSASRDTARSPDYSNNRSDGSRTGHEGDHGHPAGEILECTVSEPHKENDGTKDSYVSYLITTNVCPSSKPDSNTGS